MTRASRFLAALDACLPPERMQHGRVERMAETIADANGAIGRPYVGEGTLGRLHRRCDISAVQRQAGEEFAYWFRAAGLDPLRATDFGTHRGKRPANFSPAITEHARLRVNGALDALGGLDSPLGACAWHVLGMESTIAEWAQRTGWAGQPIRHESAKLVLIAALGILVVHFRLGQPEAPIEKT